jgi:ATP phosphoribosyltransferase
VVVVFILVPKNQNLKKYLKKALSYIKNIDPKKVLEVRGEDVPSWIQQFLRKGRKVIGLTGEDLYREYCLEERESAGSIIVLKRINWYDEKALFKKPTLCLIGPKEKSLGELEKNLTVCISSKYKKIAKKYLNFLEVRGDFVFKKIYVNGSTERSCSEGIADLVVDIVYTGSSIDKYGLKIYDRIMQSDFLILGGVVVKMIKKPRRIIEEMEKYDPPIENRKGKLCLDFNENTLGCSPNVIKALRDVTSEEIAMYPEYGKFTKKLASYLNLNEEEIFLTNGTDEAIRLVIETFLDKDDEIILPIPTFSMFKVYASLMEAKITSVLYNDNFSFPTRRILKKNN